MKQIRLAALCLLLLPGLWTRAQGVEEMKKWNEYMTPADMHAMLAKADGQWKEIIKMWMAPNTPPQEMVSTCVNKMILGGRYQESIHTGDMNGMPFEGRGLIAYDNIRKVFINTWVDNTGTGLLYMEGSWDDKTKSITFTGKMVDPMSGKEVPVKEVFTFVDDNNQKMEMYITAAGGKTYKSMEMTLIRL